MKTTDEKLKKLGLGVRQLQETMKKLLSEQTVKGIKSRVYTLEQKDGKV